ncbi:MAG: exodeoxyribonuclease VII large subunit [Candidatus Lindowbacteria bacterium]|nr:exodeoxyribonuclease VII large subunit [Candidatus Lindowbacteria bacterium]
MKRLIESEPFLTNVCVIGEISNYKKHSASGHVYFTLKDGSSQVDCVFFKSSNQTLLFNPENGDEVIVLASLKVYEKRGSYQLYVRKMKKGGLGELYQQYEETKKKLLDEGLMDSERKRELPTYPRRIGIVSSSDSAGLKDALKVLERRYPLAEVVIASVAVEGVESAQSIVRGLKLMAEKGNVDLVIVGRGGGSIESLWAFNTEAVARAIAGMPVPVISAVGHETDTTLADLVADRRAATPTESAELATPLLSDIRQEIDANVNHLRDNLRRRFIGLLDKMKYLGKALRSPDSAIELKLERLDRAQDQLRAGVRNHTTSKIHRAEKMGARLALKNPLYKVQETMARLKASRESIVNGMRRREGEIRGRLDLSKRSLAALNPDAVLRRGYSVALFKGRAVTDSDEIGKGDEFTLKLRTGELSCNVLKSKK